MIIAFPSLLRSFVVLLKCKLLIRALLSSLSLSSSSLLLFRCWPASVFTKRDGENSVSSLSQPPPKTETNWLIAVITDQLSVLIRFRPSAAGGWLAGRPFCWGRGPAAAAAANEITAGNGARRGPNVRCGRGARVNCHRFL